MVTSACAALRSRRIPEYQRALGCTGQVAWPIEPVGIDSQPLVACTGGDVAHQQFAEG
jgi:hypothetical protein